MSASRTRDASPTGVALNVAMLQVAAERLRSRWRTLSRIEPYAPIAAMAYLQAAEDLKAEMKKHDIRRDVLITFQEELVTALRRAG